jgi:hypothetical protein
VTSSMKNLLKEPLLHFLVAGGLLFAAYDWLNRDEGEVVRITAAEVNWLKETWTRQWQRPPSEQELRGMLANYIKEELLAREARELGMDEEDIIVRRRLAQKMEFLVQDTAHLAEPSEDELYRFYETNRTRYEEPAHVSFTQVFFRDEISAQQGMQELSADNQADVGEQILLERDHARTDRQTLSGLFGNNFAEILFTLDPGQWHGPVESAYGFHLVWIENLQPATLRPFEVVRGQVRNDWYQSRRDEFNDQYFAGLLKKYDVIVEESIQPLIGPLPEIVQ